MIVQFIPMLILGTLKTTLYIEIGIVKLIFTPLWVVVMKCWIGALVVVTCDKRDWDMDDVIEIWRTKSDWNSNLNTISDWYSYWSIVCTTIVAIIINWDVVNPIENVIDEIYRHIPFVLKEIEQWLEIWYLVIVINHSHW